MDTEHISEEVRRAVEALIPLIDTVGDFADGLYCYGDSLQICRINQKSPLYPFMHERVQELFTHHPNSHFYRLNKLAEGQ